MTHNIVVSVKVSDEKLAGVFSLDVRRNEEYIGIEADTVEDAKAIATNICKRQSGKEPEEIFVGTLEQYMKMREGDIDKD